MTALPVPYLSVYPVSSSTSVPVGSCKLKLSKHDSVHGVNWLIVAVGVIGPLDSVWLFLDGSEEWQLVGTNLAEQSVTWEET